MKQCVQSYAEQSGQDLSRIVNQLVGYYLEWGLSEDRARRSAWADFALDLRSHDEAV
jgi:hypothetical protein